MEESTGQCVQRSWVAEELSAFKGREEGWGRVSDGNYAQGR